MTDPQDPSEPTAPSTVGLAATAATGDPHMQEFLDPAAAEAIPAPTDLPVPTDIDDPAVRRRGEALPEYRLQAISALALQGRSAPEIARRTQIPYATIYGILYKGMNKKFHAIYNGYLDKTITRMAMHNLELLDLLPHSYDALRDAVTGDDKRLGFEVSKYVHDRLFPQVAATHINHTFGAEGSPGNVNVQNQLNVLVANLPKLLETIVTAANTDPNKHLRDPEKVVPGPADYMPKDSQVPSAKPTIATPDSET